MQASLYAHVTMMSLHEPAASINSLIQSYPCKISCSGLTALLVHDLVGEPSSKLSGAAAVRRTKCRKSVLVLRDRDQLSGYV